MSTEKKISILHVMGSPLSEFDFDLSVFYGRMSVKAGYDKQNGYLYQFAFVHPGGDWSFPMDVEETDGQRLNVAEAMSYIKTMEPDVVLSHLFDVKASDYLSMFQLMNISTIGSPASVYSTVVNKATSRSLMAAFGLPIPKGFVIDKYTKIDSLKVRYPCVVKPTTTENSIGISLVHGSDELGPAIVLALSHSSQCIIEDFIPGREIRTAVISDKHGKMIPLPPLEYKIKHDTIRKFEDKLQYEGNRGELEMSRTNLSSFLNEEEEPALAEKLHTLAIKSHQCLQCRDFSILDCRVTDDGRVYILEANVFCSISPSSVINKMVKNMGMKDRDLMEMMVENAIQRSKEA